MSKSRERGSVLINVLQSVGAGMFTAIAGFVSSIIVARTLGVTGTASIAIALWIVFVATTIFDLGIASTQARFVPDARARGDLQSAATIESLLFRRFLIVTGLGVIGLAVAYMVYWHRELGEYIAAGTSEALFYALIVLCFVVHMFYAFEYHRQRSYHHFERIGWLSLVGMVLQVAGVGVLAIALGPPGALAGYILGSVPIAVMLFHGRERAPAVSPELEARVTRYARGFWLASLFSPLLWSRVDLFLVGIYLDAQAVGLFAAAAVISALLLQICQMVCNALLPSLVVTTRDQTADHLGEVSGRTVGVVLLALFPACFGTAALAPGIVAFMYGPAFEGAREAAVLLAIAACASAITLVGSNILNLLEKNTSLFASGVVGAIFTIGFTIYALPRYGIAGAAFARIVAQSAVALITLIQIQRQLPGSISWLAIGAKLAASIACYFAAQALLDPERVLATMPLGIVAGVLGFIFAVIPLLLASKGGREELVFFLVWRARPLAKPPSSRACGDSPRVDDGCGEVDHGLEALVGLAGAHGDALEFLQLAEEVLNEVAPSVDGGVDLEFLRAGRMLRDDDLGPALVQLGHERIAVEGLVGDQPVKGDAVDQRRHLDAVVSLTRHQPEAHQIAQRIGERQNLGRHAAFGAADGLALSPPFAPWPCRWTFTMVASIMAYSMSGSPERASNMRLKTSASRQSRKRRNAVLQLPNRSGRSRHGLPVRAIHSTASMNSRLFLPLRPGSVGLPKQCGSILAHWTSVSTSRSIRSLNHIRAAL